MAVSKTPDSESTTQVDRRWKRAVIAAASSFACLLAIVAIIGAGPVFPGIAFVLIVTSMIAASVATLLPSMARHKVALIGAVIGIGSAFAFMAYAMWRI
jgi:hypothetical protein